MEELDSNQYKEALPTSPSSSNKLQELDPSEYTELPSYADGSSPLSPVNTSPVSAMDRIRLSLGNEAGNIKFLKSKFQNVIKSKEGDLLVEDNGIWHRVNPNTFGDMDAWEATKKIVSNLSLFGMLNQMRHGDGTDLKGLSRIAQNSPNALKNIPGNLAGLTGTGLNIGAMAAGEAAGSLAGAGAGAIAGAPGGLPGMAVGAAYGAQAGGLVGAGIGGGSGEALRTSLGRLAGTFEATPEQQVKDIGWETALTLGGQGLAIGAKAGLPELRKALSYLGDTATNYGKENLSKLIGYLTDKNPEKLRWAMDNVNGVVSKAESIIKQIGPATARTEAIQVASGRQAKIVEQIGPEGKAALQGNYLKELSGLLKEVPTDFSANVGGLFNDIKQKLVDSGYGFVQKDGTFSVFTNAQIAEKLQTTVANLPNIIGPDTRNAMIKVSNLINQYSRFPTLKGVDGAKRLVDLKKAVGQSFDEFFQESVPKSIQQVVGGIKAEIETGISQQFANRSEELGQKYLSMNANYTAKKDAVDWINKEIAAGRADDVVNKLVSKSGNKGHFKDEAKSIAELLGDKGYKMLNDIKDYDAAKALVEFAPGSYEGSSFKSASKFALKVTGLTSPDRVRKTLAYGQNLLDFVKSLPPKQLKEFVGNDQNLAAAITPLLQAYDGEDHVVRELLTDAGVTQNGPQ